MTKDEIKFVSDLVVTTLGVQQSEIASVLFDIKEDETGDIKPDALKTLFDKSVVRVANFKEAETKAHDKGYSKAKAESITKFETELKEKFGITSEKQGVELIEFAVAEKLKGQGVELDDEQIKRSSLYLNTIDRLTKDKELAIKAESDKFNELQTKIQKESTFKTIAEQANEVLNLLKPILPEGKTTEGKLKADIQRERFLRELGSEYDFEIKDGKILVAKDGKILEDVHSNMIDFKEIIKQRASELWDFQEGEPRTGTGNKNDAGSNGGNKKYTGPAPKDAVEYSKMISEAKTLEEKQGIMEAFESTQKAT
jgi:hypothetical protein